jgi:hypothetical protein
MTLEMGSLITLFLGWAGGRKDEIKLLRIGLSEESIAYNDYVEECRAWGRGEKAKLGL